MKHLILIVLFILGASEVRAGTFDFNFKHLTDNATTTDFHLEQWLGIEVKYQTDADSLFYFASYETAHASIVYPMFDYTLTGIGVGFNDQITKKFRVYGQVGYYVPDTSLKGRFDCVDYSCGEGLYYGLNHKWGALHPQGLVKFDEFEVNTKGGYGITIGGELLHPLSNNFELIIGIEYRVIDVATEIHGMAPIFGDYDKNGQRWETKWKGISSTTTTFGVKYKF